MKTRLLQAADLDALLALYAHLHTTDLPRPERAVVQAVWAEALANPRIRYWGGFVGDTAGDVADAALVARAMARPCCARRCITPGPKAATR